MSRIDDLIAQKSYELDCLIAYRSIVDSGDCNTCAVKKTCKKAPRPGQMVRYNCYDYKEADQ